MGLYRCAEWNGDGSGGDDSGGGCIFWRNDRRRYGGYEISKNLDLLVEVTVPKMQLIEIIFFDTNENGDLHIKNTVYLVLKSGEHIKNAIDWKCSW